MATAVQTPPDCQRERYTGTVSFYSKLKGYGFIQAADPEVIPGGLVFVHWRNIQSEDRFPFLVKGLEVEFGIMTWKQKGPDGTQVLSARAKAVTLPGGGQIMIQEELDAQKKAFVGGQDLRYTGTLKFYDPKAGYGYIAVDPGYDLGDAKVPMELRVERAEVNAGGQQPQWMASLVVEFGIWKTAKGSCKAYNMTLPNGVCMTQAALEHRVPAVVGQVYRGEVHMWNWKQGWGLIKADPLMPLPHAVQAKLQSQVEAAQAQAASKGKTIADPQDELLYVRRSDVLPGCQMQREAKVSFQIYTDDKGAGAFDVQNI